MHKVRIGCGAGYAGDRIDPAVELVEKGALDFLVFECLAERTIAMGQKEKLGDPSKGFNPLLEERLRAVLPSCAQNGCKIVTNMGAANPEAALAKTTEICRDLGVHRRVAVVTGDDVVDIILDSRGTVLETGEDIRTYRDRIISANAYLGCEGIVSALDQGADIVITGRVADASLTLGPLAHSFSWEQENRDLIASGILAGHLLECSGQITGGYFADPGYKEVPDLWRLGFPIAEVDAGGGIIITKVDGSGGLVSVDTCKEQLLYEVHDPANYITPDGIVDFSLVRFTQEGRDRVRASGPAGKEKPPDLKVSVGFRDSFIGEGQIGYAGPGALSRANLAGEIVRRRLEQNRVSYDEISYSLIGVNSMHGPGTGYSPYEVRLRVAARCRRREDALMVAGEVEALYTNGPAGGGGVTRNVYENIGIVSTLLPRSLVKVKVRLEEAG